MAIDYKSLNIKTGPTQGSAPIDYKALNIKGVNSGTPKASQIFDGGFFSDVLDVLQVPQTALTGALDPRISVGEAVQTRYTPSTALNIKNPVGRFATDVLLDPLNLIGGLSLTTKGFEAAKLGKEAATLGAGALRGERALVTLGLGDKAIPLVKGTKILEKATEAGNAIKNLPYVGKTLEALGSTKAVAAGSKIDDIESAAKNAKMLKNLKLANSGVARELRNKAARAAVELRDSYEAILKAGKATKQELLDITQAIARPGSIEIAPALKPIASQFAKQIQDLQTLYKKLGGSELEDKVVKNVLTKESLDGLKASKPFAGQVREVGGAAGSEQFARNVGLRNQKGVTEFAALEGKSKGMLESGKAVKRISDELYATTDVARTIEKARIQALAANSTLSVAERTKAGQVAVEKAINDLIRTKPESIFSRVALTPREANAGLAAMGKAARFSEDPAQILLNQGQDVAKMAARSKFVDGFKGLNIGVPVKPGQTVPAGFARVKGIKGLENFAVPLDLKPQLEKTFKAFSSIEPVNDFVKMFDKVQNTWKGLSTFINPSFHTRNAVSNHWQLFMASVDNPLAHIRGYKVEAAIRRALKEGKPATTYITQKWKALVDDFINDAGLRSTGAFSLDTDLSAASKILDNPVGRAMGKVGESFENSSKISLYLDRRLKGYSKASAAAEVRKYLFDYSDLTDFEKNTLKRIFPFYTWTRKNLPLQVAMLIQKPARISAIAKAKQAIESSQTGKKLEAKYMPEWLQEAYPVYFGTAPDGLQRFIKLEGFLPTVDLNKLGRPLEVPFENLTPLIKTPIELISNYDFYFERQISEFKGQKKFVPLVPFTDIGLNVNTKLAKVIGNFRPLGELQKFTIDPTKGKQPTTPERLINFLVGKTYQLDPAKQKSIFDYVQTKQLSNLDADIEAAQKRGDQAEVQRLLELRRQTNAGSGLTL